jgi:hypothetical protein
MNRRGFLSSLAALPVVAAVDPEELIASTRKIFLPSRKIVTAPYLTDPNAWFIKTNQPMEPMQRNEFYRVFAKNLNEIFAAEYAKKDTDWAALYGSSGQ